MEEKKPLLIMVNWKEHGKWDLLRDLREVLNNVDILQPITAEFFQIGKRWKLNLYLSEFYLPFLALFYIRKYYVIISWSMRLGTIYGIINRSCKILKGPKHVIYDFHLNLDRKDIRYKFKILITKLALKGIDYFLTTSKDEERIYSKMFSIPRNKIRFFPISAPKYFFEFHAEIGNYIFSYGNSDRDYTTLIHAVAGLPIKLLILTQAYKPNFRLPENVEIITKPHYGSELIKLILGSKLVVLPLVASNVSAGQTALLESMALGRTVVVTENMATKEYGIDGETLFFYKAGDVQQLRSIIEKLYRDEETLKRVGQNAKEESFKYPLIRVNIMCELFRELVKEEYNES